MSAWRMLLGLHFVSKKILNNVQEIILEDHYRSLGVIILFDKTEPGVCGSSKSKRNSDWF